MRSLIAGTAVAILVTICIERVAREDIPLALGFIAGLLVVLAIDLRERIVEKSKKTEK